MEVVDKIALIVRAHNIAIRKYNKEEIMHVPLPKF